MFRNFLCLLYGKWIVRIDAEMGRTITQNMVDIKLLKIKTEKELSNFERPLHTKHCAGHSHS